MTSNTTPMPNIGGLLAPLLPALVPASISKQPAIGVLPLLSPILRQRVQLLSEASTEPWLRLLAYDTEKAARLAEIVQSGRLEPHPVSGEVEVDWEYDAKTRYRRLDLETLQAFVALEELELTFQLVYCVGDKDGGGDGWRIGEVSVTDKAAPFGTFGGYSTIAEAEKAYADEKSKAAATTSRAPASSAYNDAAEADDDEDDGYWDRYDATPARTPANESPAVKRSPAPHVPQPSQLGQFRTDSAEDAYYAQYDSVQPAMDGHDPDEEVEGFETAPPLGLGAVVNQNNSDQGLNETNGSWTLAEPPRSPSIHSQIDEDRAAVLLHPRPASSASSNGSRLVEKLEESVGKQDQNEFGVKQHVSRSIRSLFLLARSSGIDREEFERLVKTELDVLGMIEDDEV